MPPSSKSRLGAGRHRPLPNGAGTIGTRPASEAAVASPLIDHRWRLHGLLGRGGMSDVYRAGDETGTCGEVALKLVRTSEQSFANRLAEEARALESFDHPNLVRLLAAGVHDGQAYLVTELVEGRTLADRLREGPLSPQRCAMLASALGGALAYVHERGMVHRDVKPANVLLGPDQRVRLADFGIARLVDSASMTMTGTTIGTAAYMAPEQIEHHSVGTAADVWSLGITLLECLHGARVFEGTPSEVVARRLACSLQPPPDLPMPWRLLLGAMLDPSPDRRPSAAEVAGMVAGPAFTVDWAPSEKTGPALVPTHRPGPDPATTVGFAGVAAEDGEPATSVMATPGSAARARRGGGEPRSLRRGLGRRLVPIAVVVAIAASLAAWAASGPDPAHAAKRPTDPPTTLLRHATTTTTTTTLPTVATTSGALVRDVQNGISQGSVGQDVGAQILRQLDQVLMAADQNWGSNTVSNDLGQIDALIADGASSSSITPAEASVLTADVAALAGALGTPTTATTTTTAPPPAPAPPTSPGPGGGGGGGGPGHGHRGG